MNNKSERYRQQRDKLNANVEISKNRVKRKIAARKELMSKKKLQNYFREQSIAARKKKADAKAAAALAIKEAAALEAEESIPGLTIEQLIRKTKVSRAKIRNFYNLGLLPKPISFGNEVYWEFSCVGLINRILAHQRQNLSLKDIRKGLKPVIKKPEKYRTEPKWEPVIKNSKRTKYDNVYLGSEFDNLDKVRTFKSLTSQPKKLKRDIVLHIPIRLNITGHGRGRLSDIDCLEQNLRLFKKHTGFSGELVISINGIISQQMIQDVKYLQDIDGMEVGKFKIKIFQRPNFGYQWGGFYDVWLSYKYLKCQYFATLECDCYLLENWYSICTGAMEKLSGLRGYIGMPPERDLAGNTDTYFFTKRLWRNSVDEILEDVTDYRSIMTHTRGGFYFCTRELLQKMEDVYGYFTPSLCHDPDIDGVAMGEIGFASRTKQVGFNFKAVEGVAFCCEDTGWPIGGQ